MNAHGQNSGNILLVAVAMALLVAQVLVPAHALEHDSGLAQGQLCAACVAAAQLSAGSVDHEHVPVPIFALAQTSGDTDRDWTSCDSLRVRQRGPPTTS